MELGQENSPIELGLVATATYTGILLDENAQPLANRTIQLDVKTGYFVVSTPQRTDKAGRFRFVDVPANVPLQLSILHEDEKPEYYFSDGDRLFNPGEIRENDRVKSHRRVRPRRSRGRRLRWPSVSRTFAATCMRLECTPWLSCKATHLPMSPT